MIYTCGDCGVEEGKLHKECCDQEICPICKRQLLSCKHCQINFKDNQREPYFHTGFSCIRCGKFFPDFKMVSDEEWKNICGITYKKNDILCKECMLFIKIKRRLE